MAPEVSEKVAAFFGAYPKRRFSKGHILVQAGENPPGVFYLTHGMVRQYDIDHRGEEVVVNIFKSPSFFPMSYAINKTPNEYFYEAAQDVTVQMAPHEAVVQYLREHADVTFDLLARVYAGTDGLLRRLAHVMGGSARSRLVYELLVACRRFGVQRPHGACFIAVSEVELATRTGLTRETVNRTLHDLKAEGGILMTRGGLVITDVAKLETELGNDL